MFGAYKGYDGHATMMAYIGGKGYLANTELREGKQHSQKRTPAFLRKTFDIAHQLTDKPLLVRMESGNDAAKNLGRFPVRHKTDLRRAENKEDWLARVKDCCNDIHHPRDGKTVYVGSSWKEASYMTGNGEEKSICMRIVYEVIECTIDKYGHFLLIPDIEVSIFWTYLGNSDDGIIDLYHAHGEMEQYYSEIKTDMDVERLPSGIFDTNELVLELTLIAYNILRIIGHSSLRSSCAPKTKRKVRRRRISTVISNLVLMADHVTEHARSVLLSPGCSNI